MATADIVARTRSILYGNGLGEKPSIVIGASNANESVSGSLATFTLASSEGDKVAVGDVLGIYGGADADGAFLVYVTSVSTDTITGINGYLGSPSITGSDSGDLDSALLEINPLQSEHFLYQSVETVFNSLLWPDLFEFKNYSVTPDLSDYQVELNAAVEEIINAKQSIAGTFVDVMWSLDKNMSTSVSSTTVLAALYAMDGSSVYLTTRNRLTESSTLNEAQTQCIATGAAAIAAGASISGAAMEPSNKDNMERVQLSPAQQLWRDFVTLRTALADDQSREIDWFEIHR